MEGKRVVVLILGEAQVLLLQQAKSVQVCATAGSNSQQDVGKHCFETETAARCEDAGSFSLVYDLISVIISSWFIQPFFRLCPTSDRTAALGKVS